MSETYQPGDVVYGTWNTSDSTGAAVYANSPAMTVYRNNALDGAVAPTLGTPLAGLVTYNFTIPASYLLGDVLAAVATGTPIASVGVRKTVKELRLDTRGVNILASVNKLFGTPTTVDTTGLATLANQTALQNSVNKLYGTPVTFPVAVPNLYATAANQTTIINNQATMLSSVNNLYGTPVTLPTNPPALYPTLANQTSILANQVAQGGTPAQNKVLITALQNSVNTLFGTPVTLPTNPPALYATSSNQTTIINNQSTVLSSINQLYGTPVTFPATVPALYATAANQTTIINNQVAQGGTPAQNKALLNTLTSSVATLQGSVNSQGGTPASIYGFTMPLATMIVNNVYTAASLINAGGGGGGSGTPMFLPADIDAIRTASAITGIPGSGTQNGNTFTMPNALGKTVSVSYSDDGNTRTVTVS